MDETLVSQTIAKYKESTVEHVSLLELILQSLAPFPMSFRLYWEHFAADLGLSRLDQPESVLRELFRGRVLYSCRDRELFSYEPTASECRFYTDDMYGEWDALCHASQSKIFDDRNIGRKFTLKVPLAKGRHVLSSVKFFNVLM